jgi:hypothetical protein
MQASRAQPIAGLRRSSSSTSRQRPMQPTQALPDPDHPEAGPLRHRRTCRGLQSLFGPPILVAQVLYLTGRQARALGRREIDPELLLLGVLDDVRTPWPRCMSNPWVRRLHASVGLPAGYRGAAGLLLAELGVDLDGLRDAVSVELREPVA